MANASLFFTTSCYGGQASAGYLRSLLALRAACAARGLPLRLDLGGGEALVDRGRGVALGRFLASDATCLLFVEADLAFAPEALFRLLECGHDVVGSARAGAADAAAHLTPAEGLKAGLVLISRAAAERVCGAHPELTARLADLQHAGTATAPMVFQPVVDPVTRRYLADHDAFCHRWRALGGQVWLDGEPIRT